MHYGKSAIAGIVSVDDDPNGRHVVDLTVAFLLTLHFLIMP
jgi:hypothetical protein